MHGTCPSPPRACGEVPITDGGCPSSGNHPVCADGSWWSASVRCTTSGGHPSCSPGVRRRGRVCGSARSTKLRYAASAPLCLLTDDRHNTHTAGFTAARRGKVVRANTGACPIQLLFTSLHTSHNPSHCLLPQPGLPSQCSAV